MNLYTVHVPDDTSDLVTRADRTVFIREGVNGSALVFGLLFLLWHRLWIAAAAWIAVALALGAFGWVFHIAPGIAFALGALMHLFVGVEGNDLRRWGLERRRFRLVDVVSGWAQEDAELTFFHRQPAPNRATRPMASRVSPPNTGPDVIGMFPESGAP